MKLALVLLTASCAANVALLVALTLPQDSTPPAPPNATSPADLPQGSEPPRASNGSPGETHTPTSAPRTAPPLWTQVYSDDPPAFLQHLIAAGFPPATARAMVEDELGRRFRDARWKLTGDPWLAPYWQAPRRNLGDRDVARQLGAMSTEHQTELREIFGADLLTDDEQRLGWMRRSYGVSDPQKLVQLSAILSDYQQVGQDTRGDEPGPTSPEFQQETRQLLQREQLADIAALLTPDELAAYEYRASPVAVGLRGSLHGFRATDEEYHALYTAYRAGEPDGPSAQFNPPTLLERARAVLPPERFADLQQAVAPGAARLNRFAARLDLPLAAVAPVQQAKTELRTRANAVRRDATLTPEQRDAQLSAIAHEATQRVVAAFGERALADYQEYDGGWIRDLTAPSSRGSRP